MQGGQSHISAEYVVAADGANSRIRSMLGVSMLGLPAMQHLVNVHFMAPGLRPHLQQREAMLYFVFNARVIAVIVAHDLQRGEFVAQVSSVKIAPHSLEENQSVPVGMLSLTLSAV